MKIIKKLKIAQEDVFFILGALLVIAGVAIHHPATALVVAGAFLLLTPIAGLVSSFVRGLRQ